MKSLNHKFLVYSVDTCYRMRCLWRADIFARARSAIYVCIVHIYLYCVQFLASAMYARAHTIVCTLIGTRSFCEKCRLTHYKKKAEYYTETLVNFTWLYKLPHYVKIFLSIKICGFQIPITSKSDFSQAGNPKGFHQGYHEMTYTKFQVSIIFAKMMGVGGGRGPLIILNPEKAEGNMQEL